MAKIEFDGFLYDGYDVRVALESPDSEIECIFNTPGGDFLDAITIHNRLRSCGKKITGLIQSQAISAGAVVAMACDKLKMYENAVIMFHVPQYYIEGQKSADNLEEMAAVLRKSEDILCTTLASRSGKTKEEWATDLKSDMWFTAQEALDAKLIDEVVPLRSVSRIENRYPERIVNFLNSFEKGKSDMALEDLCKDFGVEDEAGLRSFITNLKGQVPPAPVNVSETMVNTIVRNREMILNSLVTDGKCTPAAIEGIKTKYTDKDRVKKDLQDGNEEFDTIVNTLGKNDRILNFNGKAPTQKLGKDDGKSEDESPLVADMKKRRAKS